MLGRTNGSVSVWYYIPHDSKALLCNRDNFSKLLSTLLGSRVTNVALATA